MKLIVRLAIAALIGIGTAEAQLPDDVFGTALLELKVDPSSLAWIGQGSGVIAYYKDSIFLVTAKHVIWTNLEPQAPLRASMLVSLTHAKPYVPGKKPVVLITDLVAADRAGDLRKHPKRDIAVLRIQETRVTNGIATATRFLSHTQTRSEPGPLELSTANLEYSTKYDEANPGADVVFAGFPTSLGLSRAPQLGPHEPLVMKSILSGKNPVQKTLIIGSPVYHGNSGGAVWKVSESFGQSTNGLVFNRSISLLGVMTQLIPYDQSRLYEQATTNVNLTVSGYSVAEPMDFVIELLEMKPWK